MSTMKNADKTSDSATGASYSICTFFKYIARVLCFQINPIKFEKQTPIKILWIQIYPKSTEFGDCVLQILTGIYFSWGTKTCFVTPFVILTFARKYHRRIYFSSYQEHTISQASPFVLHDCTSRDFPRKVPWSEPLPWHCIVNSLKV